MASIRSPIVVISLAAMARISARTENRGYSVGNRRICGDLDAFGQHGRSDLLKVREDLTGREKEIDLSRILNNPYAGPKEKVTFDPKHVYDFELEKSKDETVLLKQLGSALANKQRRSIDVEVTNTDRSFGTIFGSEITKKYGTGLEEDTFVVKCTGAGGQSFGAFIPKGLTLELVGDSNDYFGKGLSGGKLVVYAPAGVKYKKDDKIVRCAAGKR